jgi:hypothetical protein
MFLLIRYMSFVTIAFALHSKPQSSFLPIKSNCLADRLVLNVPADVCRVTGPLVECKYSKSWYINRN